MTRPDVLIGLCGRAGSGKTTAADYLRAAHEFEPVAFADAIKDMLDQHLTARNIDYAHLYEPKLKEQPLPRIGLSARELMQRLGDAFRGADPDYWIKALADTAGLLGLPAHRQPVHDRIVVLDVRYPNEAAWLIEQGGVLIRLHREQATPVRAHSSEQYIDDLPASVDLVNDGPTLAGLHALIDGALESLGVVA